jgi:hypothetical protein
MRYALVSALILCALVAQAIPQKTAKRKIACKTQENAASCYWTHGRLSVANGNPSLRLWKVGTKRILGVYSGPSTFPPRTNEDSESPELPANLDRAYEAEYKRRLKIKDPDAGLPEPVFADFEVCPLEPGHPGWMQAVCVESVKNVFLQRVEPARR